MTAVGATSRKEIQSFPRQGLFALHEKQLLFLLAILLVAASIVLYYPVGHYPFSNTDDGEYVVNNFNIKYGLNWGVVKWAFSGYYLGNWHPLTWLSHAVDCELFYLNAGRHHEMNAIFHAMNALLLFWVLSRTTGSAKRSLMVAALFAVHPVNVESVVWISERKNLLSMFFFLLALGSYTWYALKPRADRYALVVLLYACALMSKPQVVTFPFILLLWDYWPLQRMFAPNHAVSLNRPVPQNAEPKSFTWLLLEKLPLFGLSAASAIVTVKAQGAAGAMRGPFNTFPFPSRLGNAIISYPRYLGKAIWPTHLAFLYPHPGRSLAIWEIIAAAVFLLATSIVVVVYRRRRYLFVGWFWFLGTLLPMIGLVQVGPQAMADRYAYLPLVGLFIMTCWGVSDWASRRRISNRWLASASIAALAVLSVTAHRQIGYWKDDVTLWSHTVNVTGTMAQFVFAALSATTAGGAWIYAGLLFLAGSICLGVSDIVYNSFLPKIAPPGRRDAVSSVGFAYGYAGGASYWPSTWPS